MTRLLTLSFVFSITAFVSTSELSPQTNDDACILCHSDPTFFQGKEDPSRYLVGPETFRNSVHEFFGMSCSNCHQEDGFPHSGTPEVSCSPCHNDLEIRFDESLHGLGLARGNPRAPTCARCHGAHNIASRRDPLSSTHRSRVPGLCGDCHGGEGLLTDELVKLPQSYQQYANSVHARGMEDGGPVGASCADCHSVHDLKGPSNPDSRISPINLAATCGRCHQAAKSQYDQSIHGRALRAGITDSPTCVDCHGAHLVLSSDDPAAPICGARQAQDTCGKCHDDPFIISKYGLQGGVVGSYLESYHGWASRNGCEVTASCVDCHTAHMILPAEDPASSISEGRVVSTCAQCHEGASPAFAAAYDHQAASITGNPVNRTIRSIYLWAIVLILGGMVVHNLVIMNYYMIKRRREHTSGEGILVRFTRKEIAQHLFLSVSFIVLLVTGFALRYPGSWWAQVLARLGMTEGLRGDIHRIAGVFLILTSLYHAYYILATPRGRRELRSLLPSRQDWQDVLQNLRFHTFRSEHKVEFGRYDYSQKAEYWALVWGTGLMAVTGLILWFPTLVVKVLPGVVIPASQTIHFYEAVLAGLVVLIWHFFFVVFHPEEYPMSWTWLTGKITQRSARIHHEKWYNDQMEEKAAEERLVSDGTESDGGTRAGEKEEDGVYS